MRVTKDQTIEAKMSAYIQQMPDDVIIRAEVAHLGSPRQISRGFKALVQKGVIVKLGYGIYAKMVKFEGFEPLFLKNGFIGTAVAALEKLNVPWEPSQATKDYNAGLTTQVPVSPKVKINSRFNRKIAYKGTPLRFE